jgi:hypothetical protein
VTLIVRAPRHDAITKTDAPGRETTAPPEIRAA